MFHFLKIVFRIIIDPNSISKLIKQMYFRILHIRENKILALFMSKPFNERKPELTLDLEQHVTGLTEN